WSASKALGLPWQLLSLAVAQTLPLFAPPLFKVATIMCLMAKKSLSPPVSALIASWCGLALIPNSGAQPLNLLWCLGAHLGWSWYVSRRNSASAPQTLPLLPSMTAAYLQKIYSAAPKLMLKKGLLGSWRPLTTLAPSSPPWLWVVPAPH